MSERGLIYTSHFGLKVLPFENVPDPAFFFGQGGYNRVLEHLTACCAAGRGLMVVLGPIGSGKTTLSQKIMFSIPESSKLIWMPEPPEISNDFFLLLAQELGSESPQSQPRSFTLRNIRDRLFELYKEGRQCLVIVDEVHKISDDVLEAVRLLNNLEYGASKLIQLILLGQEEFMTRLAQPELSSFHQRIAALEMIGQMDPIGIREYILHRLNVAGSHSQIFTDDAIDAVSNITGGTPRLTNSLCDRALQAGFYRGKAFVDLDEVKEAAQELGDAGIDRKLFFYLLNHKHVNPESKGLVPEPGSQFVSHPIEPMVTDGHVSDLAGTASKEHRKQSGSVADYGEIADARWSGPAKAKSVALFLLQKSDRSHGLYSEFTHQPFRFELALPLISLTISICILAASLWFYCERTGLGWEHCLESLLGFLR
jgi:type II secretory pathway predicted ATPase ExeA